MLVLTEQQYIANGGKRLWLPDASAALRIIWANLLGLTSDVSSTDTITPSADILPVLVKLIDLECQALSGVTSESFEGYSYGRSEVKDFSALYAALLEGLGFAENADTANNIVIGSLDTPC